KRRREKLQPASLGKLFMCFLILSIIFLSISRQYPWRARHRLDQCAGDTAAIAGALEKRMEKIATIYKQTTDVAERTRLRIHCFRNDVPGIAPQAAPTWPGK